MKMADAPSKRKWDMENTRVMTVKFQKKTDQDVIDFLEDAGRNKRNAIISAVREYILNHPNEKKSERVGKPKMAFEVVLDSVDAIRQSGYDFDEEAERVIDKDFFDYLLQTRSRRFAENKVEMLWDMDGSLYKGEDGEYYAVEMVYAPGYAKDGSDYMPLCWHRLKKRGG